MSSREGRRGEVHHMLMGTISDRRYRGHAGTGAMVVVVGRHGRGAAWDEGAGIGGEIKNGRILVGGTNAATRMAFDHALRCKELLDLLPKLLNAVILLLHASELGTSTTTTTTTATHPHPIWAFCAKSETFKTETNACLAVALSVWSFVAFLGDARGEQKIVRNKRELRGWASKP